jgi:hypothetical protein
MWIDSFGHSFMWIIRFVRDSFVGSFFRGSRSLGHICARLARPLGHSFIGSARGSHSLDNFVGLFRWSCGRLCPFVREFSCGLFVSCLLVGIRSEDLGRGVLEGNFCTVERL